MSQYLCIGKYSAVTFQVLGNMKTVLILVLGVVFFSAPITVKDGAGITVAICGMFMYSWATERAKIQKDAVPVGVELPTNQKVELESNDREGKGEVNHEGEEKMALLSAVSEDEP